MRKNYAATAIAFLTTKKNTGTPLPPVAVATKKKTLNFAGLMAVATGLMIADISIHHMVMASLAFGTGIVALIKVSYMIEPIRKKRSRLIT